MAKKKLPPKRVRQVKKDRNPIEKAEFTINAKDFKSLPVSSKKDAFLDLLQKNLGLKAKTCLELGVSRGCIDRWLKTDATFEEQYNMICDSAFEFVESKLYEGISKGDSQLIIFYLQRQGKNRGYSLADSENPTNNINIQYYLPQANPNIIDVKPEESNDSAI